MVLNYILKYGEIIAAVVGVFSIIAAATPNKTDDSIMALVSKIINLVAFNFGNAENKKEDK